MSKQILLSESKRLLIMKFVLEPFFPVKIKYKFYPLLVGSRLTPFGSFVPLYKRPHMDAFVSPLQSVTLGNTEWTYKMAAATLFFR